MRWPPTVTGLLVILVALAAQPSRAETELVVAVYPPLDEGVRAGLQRWELLHPDVRIKVVPRAFGDHHTAMITALASGQQVPDVLAIEASFLGRTAAAGELEDLSAPPYDAGPLLRQLLPYTRGQAVTGQGALVAFPADAAPGTLFYRKDLLDRAGVTEAELTRSWDSFVEAGRRLKAATGARLVGDAADLLELHLRGRLRDGQGVYLDRDGWPVFGWRARRPEARFAEAFALVKKVREAGLDAGARVGSGAWAEGLRSGAIAVHFAGPSFGEHLRRWIAPEAIGLWRSAQLPGGGFAAIGGVSYAIPRRAAHKAEAWELIRFLCLDRYQQVVAFETTGGWPVLRALQDSPFIDEPVDMFGGQQVRRVWRNAAARIPVVPVNRCDLAVEVALHRALERVLDGGASVEDALSGAAQQGPWATPGPRPCPWSQP